MDKKPSYFAYCEDLFNRKRLKSREILIGNIGFGSDNAVRIQSMTTVDTMNTQACVEESIRMIDAGCELVRLTAPSKKEAENLLSIKNALASKGFAVPIVADIHFTPNAAEIAATIVEKVRINPGNYADKKRFESIDYTEESYLDELQRIEDKFTPLVKLCKENGTTIRIGTNHGSLSDRIMSRYGDTPDGMVESAMEFLRICIKNDFHEIVLSMKASNTLIMVQAYRLLAARMKEENMNYPLHLGVTEAGEGEDGRIKSAVGIGTLLEDGLGDTIRVSLTENPEEEIPVAKKLLKKYEYDSNKSLSLTNPTEFLSYNPYSYEKRESSNFKRIGGQNSPVVIADLSQIPQIKHSHFFGFGYHYSIATDKWNLTDQAADVLYIGSQKIDFELPGTLLVATDYTNWKENYLKKDGYIPVLDIDELDSIERNAMFFLNIPAESENISFLSKYPNAIVILATKYVNKTQLYRLFRLNLANLHLNNPVILCSEPDTKDAETFQLWASSEIGSQLIDGFGDGIWLKGKFPSQLINSTSFGILQATRTRISKTEYISCPSCGRTLFDLQETTQNIRSRTSHLKGIKIGIMGCIVNGPGEMADADYGYVGTGPGKIHLYKEREIVRKNIPEENAVEALIELIKENGDWIDPQVISQ